MARYGSSAPGASSLLDITGGMKELQLLLPFQHYWEDQMVKAVKKQGETIYSQKREEKGIHRQKKKFKMLRNYYPWQIRSENELKSHSTQKVMAWLWVQCSRGRPLVGVERLGPSLEKRGGRKDHHTPPRVDAFTGNRQEDLFQE